MKQATTYGWIGVALLGLGALALFGGSSWTAVYVGALLLCPLMMFGIHAGGGRRHG